MEIKRGFKIVNPFLSSYFVHYTDTCCVYYKLGEFVSSKYGPLMVFDTYEAVNLFIDHSYAQPGKIYEAEYEPVKWPFRNQPPFLFVLDKLAAYPGFVVRKWWDEQLHQDKVKEEFDADIEYINSKYMAYRSRINAFTAPHGTVLAEKVKLTKLIGIVQ